MLDILSFFCELRVLLFTRFFFHLIKHFYSYGLVFYLLLCAKGDKDKAEDNTFLPLWAIVVVLDIITLKQDVILIFYRYLGQT